MKTIAHSTVAMPDLRIGLIVRFVLLVGALALLGLTTGTILINVTSGLARTIFACTVAVPLFVLFYCLQQTWARLFAPAMLMAVSLRRSALAATVATQAGR